jgi:hypothetical protein
MFACMLQARKLEAGQMLTESCFNTSRGGADMTPPTMTPVFANSRSVIARGATRVVREGNKKKIGGGGDGRGLSANLAESQMV